MSRISLTSSTVPFSQVAMMRRFDPGSSGTLVTRGGPAAVSAPTLTSMNVRRHLFLQK